MQIQRTRPRQNAALSVDRWSVTREVGRMSDGLAHLMARTALESRTGQRGATPLSEAFLLDHGVRPWMELPLWVPRG